LFFPLCLTGCFEVCLLGCNEGDITDEQPNPNEIVEIVWGESQAFRVDTNGFGSPVWSVSILLTAYDVIEAEIGFGKLFTFNLSPDIPLNKMDLSVELRRTRLMFVCAPMLPSGQPCMFHSGLNIDDSRLWNVRISQDPPIWEGNYLIEENTDMENLNDFTEVTGQLGIVGFDTLVDLEPLSNLTSVGGLYIVNNGSLINLTGLEGLMSVGGLIIDDNDSLTTLTGLDSITSVSGSISIGSEFGTGNGALINLEALNNISSVDGYIEIIQNDSLSSLTMESLESVGEDFTIHDNFNLCTYLAEDLRNQVIAGGGIGGEINISGNKDCSSP